MTSDGDAKGRMMASDGKLNQTEVTMMENVMTMIIRCRIRGTLKRVWKLR